MKTRSISGNPKQATLQGWTAEDLEPTHKVGLRIPFALLLVVMSKWIGGGDRYQSACQTLLENSLRDRAAEADDRAMAYARGDLSSLESPLSHVSQFEDEELRQVTVKLSPAAYTIAEKLGLQKGKSLSIQKVCEPILCEELNIRRDEAIDALQDALSRLKEQDADGVT